MTTNSEKQRPHFVDEDTETVYLTVCSWMGAQAAPHWVKRHYPGFKCSIVTEERLKEKLVDKEDA